MEIKRYWDVVRRWLWLLLLGLALGAGVGYAISLYQPAVYEATTRILATEAAAQQSTGTDPTYGYNQPFAETYVQLLTTRPILDAASAKLGYPIDARQLQVEQVGYTQVIEMTVQDHHPQHAADIANALVQALIDQNESLQAGRYAATEKSLQEQVDQTQAQITALQSQVNQVSSQTVKDQLAALKSQIDPLQAEVTSLQKEIAAAEPSTALSNRTKIAADQARLAEIQPLLNLYQQIYSNLLVLGQPSSDVNSTSNTQLAQLQNALDLYRQVYLNLLSSLQSVRLARLQNTPNVVQIEAAEVPKSPVRPLPLANVPLGSLVGLMLAGGVVFVVEYLDDTLKTPEDVQRVLNLPVLGFIGELPQKDPEKKGLYALQQPRSPIAEAFRSLRTNLEFSSVDRPLQKLLITSAEPGDGKTTIAVNLATVLAQSGKHVILVDADLRKPRVHSFAGLPNRTGLSDLFRNSVPAQLAMQKLDGSDVAVVTSGSLPPNPSELLSSTRMDQILAELTKMSNIVVLDSPPAVVADIQILAAKADGVLLVLQPGGTKTQQARATLEQLGRAGARVVGAVFNRIPRSRPYYYGGYQHYSPYSKGGYGYYGEEDSWEEIGDSEPGPKPPVEKEMAPEKLAKAR